MNELQVAKMISTISVVFALVVCPLIIWAILRRKTAPICKATYKGLDAKTWQAMCKAIVMPTARIEAMHALCILQETDRLKFLFTRETDQWVKCMAALYIFRLDPNWKPLGEYVVLFCSAKFAQLSQWEWNTLVSEGTDPLQELKRLVERQTPPVKGIRPQMGRKHS